MNEEEIAYEIKSIRIYEEGYTTSHKGTIKRLDRLYEMIVKK